MSFESHAARLGVSRDVNWSVVPLPAAKTRRTFLQAENLTISSTSKHADAAGIISYMQQLDVLAKYLPERNKLSARQDIADQVVDEDPC